MLRNWPCTFSSIRNGFKHYHRHLPILIQLDLFIDFKDVLSSLKIHLKNYVTLGNITPLHCGLPMVLLTKLQ